MLIRNPVLPCHFTLIGFLIERALESFLLIMSVLFTFGKRINEKGVSEVTCLRKRQWAKQKRKIRTKRKSKERTET